MTILGRDDQCEKGLYTRDQVFYCKGADGAIHYGDTIHGLLEEAEIPKKLNAKIIPTYLRYWSPYTQDTFYQGVKRLLPGYRLTQVNGNAQAECYERPEFTEGRFSDFDEAVDALKVILEDILAEERKHSDTSFLSAGVDSCTLAAALPAKQVVTVGYDEAKYDESRESVDIAAELHTDIHVRKVSAEDYFAIVPEALLAREEPTGDSSYIPLYLAAQEAAKYTTACCSGEGPDELFCGYSYYQNFLKNPQVDFWRIAHTCMKTKPTNECMEYVAGYPDGFQRLQAFDLTWATACNLLPNLDAAGRGNGIDVRTPFVNRRLFDFVMAIPVEWKVDSQMVKLVFRAAAENYLPQSIAQKPKRAFPVPTMAWMHQEPYESMLKETFASKEAKMLIKGLIPKYYLKKFFAEGAGREASGSYWHPVWTMYALVEWYRCEFGGKRA